MARRRSKFDFTGSARLRVWLASLWLLLAVMGPLVGEIGGQDRGRVGRASLLPPSTGEPFTIAAKDLPDISCSVVEWKDDPPKPTLSVVCPPQEVFAPIHVYLKLSWLRPQDVPAMASRIIARAKSLVKIRTNETSAWVWLTVREKQDGGTSRTWMAFNGLEDVALLTDPTK